MVLTFSTTHRCQFNIVANFKEKFVDMKRVRGQHRKSAPLLCMEGRCRRPSCLWCHWACRWWRPWANPPASLCPSALSSGKTSTPGSAGSYIGRDNLQLHSIGQICSHIKHLLENSWTQACECNIEFSHPAWRKRESKSLENWSGTSGLRKGNKPHTSSMQATWKTEKNMETLTPTAPVVQLVSTWSARGTWCLGCELKPHLEQLHLHS